MRCAAQFRGGASAIRCAGQVDGDMTGAVEVARLPPGQGNDIAPARNAEVSQRGVTDETTRSGNHAFLYRHARASLIFARLNSRSLAGPTCVRLAFAPARHP